MKQEIALTWMSISHIRQLYNNLESQKKYDGLTEEEKQVDDIWLDEMNNEGEIAVNKLMVFYWIERVVERNDQPVFPAHIKRIKINLDIDLYNEFKYHHNIAKKYDDRIQRWMGKSPKSYTLPVLRKFKKQYPDDMDYHRTIEYRKVNDSSDSALEKLISHVLEQVSLQDINMLIRELEKTDYFDEK